MKVTETIYVSYRLTEMEELYEKAFPLVGRFVRKMGGGLEDAKDVFHDALVIFYEKTAEPDFTITTAAEAYLLGISKHLWLKKFNKDYKKVSLDDVEKEISIPADYLPDATTNRLLEFLEQAGKRCVELLSSFYYERLPMKQLAEKLGYGSERSATAQKYKCLEKVRDAVKQKNVSYEDFAE